MNRGIVLSVAILATSTLFAQNGIEKALAEIEANNTTLKAMQKTVEAQKRANHADNAIFVKTTRQASKVIISR